MGEKGSENKSTFGRLGWSGSYSYTEIFDFKALKDIDSSPLSMERQSIISADYLFNTCTAGPFFEISMEMEELNDFCCLSQLTSEVWWHFLVQKYESFERGDVSDLEKEWEGELTTHLADSIYSWSNTKIFISQAMCLIMLSTFTEKSLKTLCSHYAPRGKRVRFEKGKAKIDSCLEFLSTECRCVFSEPKSSKKMRNKCRSLRNNFAHGEWDKVREEVESINIRDAFLACSQLLYAIEKGIDD